MAQTEVEERELTARCSSLLEELPPFPPIAMRLSAALAQPMPDVSDVAELFHADPALSAELLRRANSAVYGFAARVDSIHKCLVLLGFDETRRIALASATSRFAADALRLPDLRRCWRHSLACAVLAEELANGAGIPPERAYTAGLMHDIGRLALLTAQPESYVRLLQNAAAGGPVDDCGYFIFREREAFGIDHCTAGCWLVERWSMPLELQAVAGRHHDRPDESKRDLLWVIQRACSLADALGFGISTALTVADPAPLLADLPLPEKDPERLRTIVEARIARLDDPADGEDDDGGDGGEDFGEPLYSPPELGPARRNAWETVGTVVLLSLVVLTITLVILSR